MLSHEKASTETKLRVTDKQLYNVVENVYMSTLIRMHILLCNDIENKNDFKKGRHLFTLQLIAQGETYQGRKQLFL